MRLEREREERRRGGLNKVDAWIKKRGRDSQEENTWTDPQLHPQQLSISIHDDNNPHSAFHSRPNTRRIAKNTRRRAHLSFSLSLSLPLERERKIKREEKKKSLDLLSSFTRLLSEPLHALRASLSNVPDCFSNLPYTPVQCRFPFFSLLFLSL